MEEGPASPTSVGDVPHRPANRLASATSPYLLQHADNPVDWWEWGEDAFASARERGVPVLLSVGYSACHWCHVMAHESFEDEATAAYLNERYVSIKVDREERPDVDSVYMQATTAMTGHGGWPMTVVLDHDGNPFFAGTYFPDTARGGMPSFRQVLEAVTEAWTARPDVDQIYQTAHALMTRRNGGWPLTVFMTPDGAPFFAGTYFPKDGRHGLPGLRDLLPHIARVYAEKREAIDAQGDELKRALRSLEPLSAVDALPLDARERALQALRTTFDATHGGFGRAPKFPHVPELRLAVRAHLAQPASGALAMAALTATRMAEGGINDQLGGGFCRYSVDEQWQIPHFEKMLYDNGPLLGLYADLWARQSGGFLAEAVAAAE